MTDWTSRLSDLRTQLTEKLGVTGTDFGAQVRRAGRRLPRRARRDAETLIRAEEMARHPKLARLIDPREVSRAQRRMSHRLGVLDPARDRRDRRLNLLAALGLYVLVTFALVVTVLRWRGYV
jgi:hypothetical protein